MTVSTVGSAAAGSVTPLTTSTIFDGVLANSASATKTTTIPVGSHQLVASDRVVAYTSKGYEVGTYAPNTPAFLNVGAADTAITVSRVPDGTTVATATLPTSQTWAGVAYGGGVFVAVPSTSGTAFASSPNGITWTARTSTLSAVYYGVVWNQKIGLFLAWGNSSSYVTSPDGINWTTRTAPVGTNAFNLSSANDKFFIIGAGSGYYSTDGINWTSLTLAISTQTMVAYGNGVYISGNTAATAAAVAYSTNGINWTSITVPAAGANGWQFPLYQNGTWVILQTAAAAGIVSTDNGLTWVANTPTAFNATGVSNAAIAGEGIFLACSNTANTLIISLDGKVGNTRTFASGVGSVAIGKGTIVVLPTTASNTTISYSLPAVPANPVSFGVYAAPVTVN